MRNNVSLPRLAIVVAWAALAPHSRWSELLPTAAPPDSGPVPQGNAGNWNGWVLGYGSASTTENYLRGRAALAQAEADYKRGTLGDWQVPDSTGSELTDRGAVMTGYFALTDSDATFGTTAGAPRRGSESLVQIAERTR